MTAREPAILVCVSCGESNPHSAWNRDGGCPACGCAVCRRETDVERRLREAEKQIARLESRPRGGGRWPILLRYGVPL